MKSDFFTNPDIHPGVLLGAGGLPAVGVHLVTLRSLGLTMPFMEAPNLPAGASIATLTAGRTLTGRARFIAAQERDTWLESLEKPVPLSADASDVEAKLRLSAPVKGRARFIAAQQKSNATHKT